MAAVCGGQQTRQGGHIPCASVDMHLPGALYESKGTALLCYVLPCGSYCRVWEITATTSAHAASQLRIMLDTLVKALCKSALHAEDD